MVKWLKKYNWSFHIIRLIYLYVTKGNGMKIVTSTKQNVYKTLCFLTINSAIESN